MSRAREILEKLDEGAIKRAAHRVKGTYHREMARYYNKKMRPDFTRENTPKEQEAENKWDKHTNKMAYHMSRSVKNEEEIDEVAARRTISFRGGSRHIRYKCPPGWKRVGKSCSKIQTSVRIARGRELKKAWRRRRGKMPRQKIARNRTFRRMRQSGYKPGGGRR